MIDLSLLPLVATGAERACTPPACRWFDRLAILRVDGAVERVTGAHETCALLLSGTFDLVGGGTAWPARGARPAPTAGRPVAVFLPRQTPFAARQGQGEILLLSARQPDPTPPTGADAPKRAPLLQLAGSGKAFDPGSGEWKPAETFPTAPESLPPRRIERVVLGSTAVERVFAQDYKAATLTVDEAVLPADAALRLADLALPPAVECLLYVRTEGECRVQAGAASVAVTGEGAVLWRGAPAALTLTAHGGPAYAVLGYAGK